jgi:hypothetical protein
MMRRDDAGTLFVGLVLIGLGAIFLLHIQHAFHLWWPMVIIFLGVAKVTRNVWSGLWLIAIGAWLQFIQLRLFDLTYSNSWPLLLIALGGVITLRALFETAGRREKHP